MLPKLQHPVFDVMIPSSGIKYQFRPYTVLEQKILLLMQEVEIAEELTNLILQLIQSCYVGDSRNNKPLDVNKLTYFDVEYIFLKIRTKSVSDDTTISFRCNNTLGEDGKGDVCGEVNNIKVRLDDIEIKIDPALLEPIHLTNDLFIQLNFPSIRSAHHLEKYNATKDLQELFLAIQIDLKSVMSSDKVYDEFDLLEVTEFLNSLDLKSFKSILEFYVNIPSLKKNIMFKCTKCGYNDTITLSGLVDFFG